MTTEERQKQILQYAIDIRAGKYDRIIAHNIEHWTLKGKSVPVWMRSSRVRTEDDREYMRNYMRKRRREDRAPKSVCGWECIDVLGAKPCPYNKCRRDV